MLVRMVYAKVAVARIGNKMTVVRTEIFITCSRSEIIERGYRSFAFNALLSDV